MRCFSSLSTAVSLFSVIFSWNVSVLVFIGYFSSDDILLTGWSSKLQLFLDNYQETRNNCSECWQVFSQTQRNKSIKPEYSCRTWICRLTPEHPLSNLLTHPEVSPADAYRLPAEQETHRDHRLIHRGTARVQGSPVAMGTCLAPVCSAEPLTKR